MSEKFLIGTYTHSKSEGIYELELNSESKKLENLKLVAKAGNPTYVALSKKNRIYSVDKVFNAGGQKGNVKGGVLALDFNAKPAKPINSIIKENTNPAYITVDEKRQFVYTANYHTGQVRVYQIENNGSLKYLDEVVHQGSVGPRPEQQDGAHPHFADLTPDGRLVVVDLGQDRVYLYDISDNGQLSEVSHLQMPAGYGPRHIVFDAKKHVAYLAGELSSNVASLKYDASNGQFSIQQIVKTIPKEWESHNGAAAIRLSADGKFVYVSNRGNNSLAVFETSSDGHLKLIQYVSTDGDFPRDFNFADHEKFIITLNQNTNNATLYERNQSTGKLTIVQRDFYVPEGVCVYPED
ncbi:6-phosphogluconolactonase [Philodulcilactobacillus myokoensis]|uniref:6-phosphogluconolactonase n=1 Tax=Philodulcilactobacillus myokoensis TaxID=2929573 RepID=A0A9W6B1S4_9LACO|nr:lactonase family protein [Philodulcilactobacillus myokoensis]GLB46544.1 6-phosphogluconolactonase [Philodulcilactobacillus myokoensis]